MKTKLIFYVLTLSLLSFSPLGVDLVFAAQGGSSSVKSFFDSAAKGGSGSAPANKVPEPAPAPQKGDVKAAESPTPSASAVNEITSFEPAAKIVVGDIKQTQDNHGRVYENVSVTMPEEMPGFEIRISKIFMNGMDAASYEGNFGDTTKIEKVSLQGIKLLAGETPLGDLEEILIEGLTVPYRDILKAFQDSKNKPDNSELSSTILPLLYKYSSRLIQINKLQFDTGSATLSLEQMEGKECSATSSGPMFIKNLQVTSDGKSVLSLEKIGYEGINLPEIKGVSQLFAIMADPLGALDKLAIRGLSLDALQADIPGLMPVALSKITCDLLVENKTLTVSNKIDGLGLALSKLQDTESLAILVEAAGKKDVLLNMDLSANYDAQQVATFKATLSEKERGNISLDVSYAQVEGTSGVIRSAELKADNKGIIDLLLAMYAINEDEEGSLDELLEDFLESLEDLPKDAIDKVTELVQKGGLFRLTLRPAEPIKIDDIEKLLEENPAALGYEIDYKAPATPIAQ